MFLRKATGSQRNIKWVITVLAILIVLTFSVSALAFSIIVTINGNAPFQTTVAKCTTPACSDLTSSGTTYGAIYSSSTGTASLNYPITDSGQVSYVGYDYVACNVPYIAIFDFQGNENTGTTRTRTFSTHKNRNATINSAIPSTTTTTENQEVIVTANINSAIKYPSFSSGRKPPIPTDLKDYFSYTTDVTFTVYKDGSQFELPKTVQVSPLMESTENAVFKFTPTQQGTYTVDVKTKVSDCQADSSTATEKTSTSAAITVTDTMPSVDFTVFDGFSQTGQEPFTTKFKAILSGNDLPPQKVKWDFGDGVTLEDGELNPTHQYTNNGPYTVTLTVTDADGTVVPTVSKTNFIQVTDLGIPTANFQANPTSGTERINITFTDLSNPTPREWYWNFGDGSQLSPSTQHPIHEYKNNGTYTASLVVKDEDGESSQPFTKTITVGDSSPTVDFSASPLTEDQLTQFTSSVTNVNDPPVTYQWDFQNDGAVDSADPNPQFNYTTPGTYTVVLKVKDADDVNPATVPKDITISPVNDAPKIQGIILIPVKTEDFSQISQFTLDLTLFEANADEDDSGAALTWNVGVADTSVVNGVVTDSVNNIATFTSVPNASGSTQVTFTLKDSGGLTDTQIVTFQVDPDNDKPTVLDIPDQQWDEDTVKTINLLDYFSDVEGPFQSILPVSQPSNIQVSVSDFVATLTPDPNFNTVEGGSRTVEFIGTDAGQPTGTNVKTVTSRVITLTVNPVNEISGSTTTGSTINEFSTVTTSTVTSSQLVNSTVTNSNVQNSQLTSSSLSQGSVAQNSVLVNVTLVNSTVIDTTLENVVLVNTFIDPSNVKNSQLTDSTIINSNVTDSTITRSRIENMTVTSATVTDDVLQSSGTIVFLGETYSTPSTTLAFIKDRPPVLASNIDPITWNEDTADTSLNLNTKFSDPDNPTLTFTFSPNPVSNINIQIVSGAVTLTPDANFTDTRTVTFTAADNLGKSAQSNTVALTVSSVNDKPILVPPFTLTATEDSQYLSALEVSDIDSTAFTFSLLSSPTGMSINPSDGELTWTPDNSQVGPNLVSAKVDDGSGGTDTINFTITISNTNDAPTTSIIPVQTWPEDTVSPELNLSQSFSDVDVGDILTFSVVQNPTNVVVNLVGNLVTFTPNANFTGVDSIKFRATDFSGDFTDSNPVTLNVTPVNDAPTATLIQPNGGELWNGIKTINWSNDDIDLNPMAISFYYSNDSGATWNFIAYYDGSSQFGWNYDGSGWFNWNTTGLDGSTFKVNVTVFDVEYAYASDISDGVFSVDNTPPSVDIGGVFELVEGMIPVYTSIVSDNIAGVDNNSFFWNFGDGVTSTDQNPNHLYTQNGTFTLTLTVKDLLGNQNSTTKTVVVNDTLPVSSFTFNPSTGISEGTTTVNFNSSLSSAYDSPLTLFWDFGDGTNSTNPNPTKIYNSNDTYTVTLTVTDSDSSQAQSQQVVTVDDLGPTASFVSTPTSNIFENTTQVNFTDQSSSSPDTISTYLWDFGDSTTSNLQNPTHTFVSSGVFIASLVVTDSDGSPSTPFTENITVLDKSPTAEAGSNQVVDEGSLVFFDGSASTSNPDSITSYFWDFGDGSNSTGALVNHTYTQNNTYTVTLTVIDSDSSPNSDSLQITVQDKSPSVDFTFNPANPGEDQLITFLDNSISVVDNKTSYLWAFGDGVENIGGVYKGSSSIDEQHAFIFSRGNPTSGTGDFWYSAGSATSGWLYTMYTLSNSVIAKYTQPVSDLSSVDCTGLTYTQDTQQTNVGDIFCININNTNRYGAIKATNIENTLSTEIPTSKGTIYFDWIYNPENSIFNVPTTDSGLNVSHSYATNGTYLVNLTVSDSDGSSNYTSKPVTVSFVNDAPTILVVTQQTRDEDFGTLSINLTNLATDEEDNPSSLTWSLSDVNTSLLSYEITPQNILNINSVGNASGTNTITLNATDSGGLQDTAYLEIIVNPINDAPVINQSNITMTEDIPYIINLSSIVLDPDNSPSQINWTGTSTFPIILTFDNENKTLTITNVANETATGQFTLTASDGQGGQTASDSIFVTVTPVNDQPIVFSPLPDITFDEDGYHDGLTDLNLFFRDVDNPVLEFTSVSDNPSILVNIVGSAVNISALPNANGQSNVTFTASDGELNVSDLILVTVNPLNDAPVVSPIDPVVFDEDNQTTINLAQYVTDVDNTPQERNWTAGPSGSPGPQTPCEFSINTSVDNVAKTLTITGNPNACGIGSLLVNAFDNDHALSNTQSISINITPLNDAPVISAVISNIAFNEDGYNDSLNLVNSVSDVDNTNQSLNWSASGQTDVIVTINNVLKTVNFTALTNFNGAENITLTVSDPNGASTSQQISVTVNSVNDNATISNLSVTGTNSSTGFFKGILTLSAQGADVDGTVTEIQFEKSLDSTNGVDGTFVNIDNSTSPVLWVSEPTSGTDSSVWIRARSMDNQGGLSGYLTQEIKVDNQAPNTTHDYDNTWKTADFTITLTTDDFNGSGVIPNNMKYRLNGGAEQSVGLNSQPVITTESGTNYLEFYSIDRLGNQEVLNNLTGIKLDKTLPSVSAIVQEPSDVTENTLTAVIVNSTVSDLISGLVAGYPKLSYKIGSGSFTTVNMTLVTGNDFTATIPTPTPDWDFFRGEVLTYKITALDVAGNQRILEVNGTIEDINDIPTVNLTGISPTPLAAAGNFSPTSVDVITQATDSGDGAGNSVSAGSIVNVTFEVSTDSTNGVDGTFIACQGSPIAATVPTFKHDCDNILADGQQDNNIWLRVRSQDNSGALSNFSTFQIKVDNAAPTTTNNIPPIWINTSFAVELTATDTNGSGVDFTKYCIDIPCDVDADGTFYTSPFVISAEGLTYITYKSTDKVGKMEAPKGGVIGIDRTPPSINSVNISDNYVKNNTSITVTVNATDMVGRIANVTAEGTLLTLQGTPPDTIPWIFSGPINLVSDQSPVNIVVTDFAGNQNFDNALTFTIDDTSPVINSVVLSRNVTQNNTPVTVIVNVTETGTISSVTVGDIQLNPQGSEIFTGTINLSTGISSSVIPVIATDAAGNFDFDNSTGFLIDDTVPTTSDNSPASWQTTSFNVTLTGTDLESGMIKITYSLDNGSSTSVGPPGGGASSFQVDVEILTDGNHTIVYNATNNADGISLTKTISAALDTVSSSVSFTSGPDNGTIVRSGFPPITTSASDLTSGLVNTTIYLDGVQIDSCSTNPTCGGPWNAVDGQHTLNATARDAAGLENVTETRTFTVDNTGPSVTLLSPLNNSISNQSTHLFQFNATDNIHPTVSCTLFVNGTSSGTNSSVVSGAITTIQSAVSEGVNNWSITCTDGVGNPGQSETRILKTDYVAPDVTVSLSGHNNLVIAPQNTNSPYNELHMVFTANELVDWGKQGSIAAIEIINSTGSREDFFFSNLVNTSVSKSWDAGEGATFAADGFYAIRVTVNDTAGNWLTKTVANFSVDNTPPSFFLESTPIVEGEEGLFNGTNGDPNEIAGEDNSSFVWDFGDGTPVQQGMVVNHTYVQNGTYTFRLNITDLVGNKGTNTTTITVLDTSPMAGFFFSSEVILENITQINFISTPPSPQPLPPLPPPTLIYEDPTPPDGFSLSQNYYEVNLTSTDTNPTTCLLEVNGVNLSMTQSGYSCFTNRTDQTEGTYTFKVWVNETTASEPITITLDTTSPAVTTNPTIYPDGQTAATNNQTVTLSVNATDLISGVNFVQVDASDLGCSSTLGMGLLLDNSTYETTCTLSGATNGTKTLTATVTDFAGNTNSTILNVEVDTSIPSPPPNPQPPPSGPPPQPFTTGYDQPLTFLWDFDDGTNSNETNPVHTFEFNGTYTVNLTVVDADGSVNSTVTTITISDRSPTPDIVGDTQIFEGTNATFNASGSTSNPDTIVSYQWTISYNDGASFELLNVTSSPVLTKQFNSNGTFLIGLLAIDSDDSGPFPPFGDLLNLTVLEKNPVAVLTGNTVVFENQTAFFNASGSDATPDTIVSYQWDFNYNGTFNPEPNITGAVVNHTYPSPSTPIAAVKVTDSDGSSNIATLSVLVKGSDHDISVDSVYQNKSTSTVYLFDTVNITANISNAGNFDENITINLKEGSTVLNTITTTIERNKTKQVSLDWVPTTAGFHNLIVEVSSVTGETNAANNQKTLETIQVFSVKNNVDLSFVNPTQYPASSQNSSSPFYVWVRVANNLTTDFKDFPVTLNTDGLTVNTTQDGNQNTVKIFNPLSGTRTFWWLLNPGTPDTKNMVITIGTGSDSVQINKTVSIV